VRRDTEVAQQQMRLRLIENHEQLTRMARELVGRTLDHDTFLVQAAAFTLEHPEVSNLIWLNDRRVRIGGYRGRPSRPRPASAASTRRPRCRSRNPAPPPRKFVRARETRQTAYSQPFPDSFGNPVFQAQIPLIDHGVFHGALLVEYSVERLLRYFVPTEIARRHAISVLDARGRSLASTVMTLPARRRPGRRSCSSCRWRRPRTAWSRGQGYRTSIGLIGNGLFWMVMLLSAHRLDAARHLAPHAPAPADAGHARPGDELGARWKTRC
jgi:hypothetical protein